MKEKQKKTNKNLTLDKDVIKALEDEAKKERLPLSTTANRVLRKFFKLDKR